jgi:hypothetical protein
MQQLASPNVPIEKVGHIRLDPLHSAEQAVLLETPLPTLEYRLSCVVLAVFAETI